MKGFRWRIDRRALAAARVRRAAEQAVADATEHILEQANRTVPIEDGTLTLKGKADSQGLKGTVSYDTPYARRQHEDTRLKHDPGRRAKWLEKTFQEERKRVKDYIADEIRKSFR